MALVKSGADVHCTNNIGYGFSGLHPRVGWCATVRGGRSVHSGVERQEWLLWLCRSTALHLALLAGKTETAMAIFLADAGTLCPSKDRYGPRAASERSGEHHLCRQCTAGGLRQSASRALGVCQLCMEMGCR
jgi:hypothetical protein